MKNLIYCVIDRKYYYLSLLFLKTLVRQYPDHPDILFHHVNLTDVQINRLERFDRVKCAKFAFNEFRNFPLMSAHAAAPHEALYGRFNIWKNGYQSYDNVIFLDVDIVICGSISNLCEQRDFFIVRDVHYKLSNKEDSILIDGSNRQAQELLAEDGISLPAYGANAGVFVVPQRYRTQSDFEELCRIGKRYEKHLRWADQSVLNLWALKHRFQFRDEYDYNLQCCSLRPAGIPRTVKIIHLNGMGHTIRIFLMWWAYISNTLDQRLLLFSVLCSALLRFTTTLKNVKHRLKLVT
jgi:hypothetical protein